MFCFLNDVEQEGECREVCFLGMHVYKHFVAEGAEVFTNRFKDSAHLVVARKVERAEVICHLLHRFFSAETETKVALTFLLADGREVVVYVVKRRFGKADKSVKNLAERVVHEVEVRR